MSAKAEKAEGAESKKKSPLPLIIGAVALVVVLFFAKGAMGGKKEEDGKDEKKPKKKHEKIVVGEYIAVEPDFTVNLTGPGDHYLKASVSLGVTKEMTEEVFKHHLAPMRDAILNILSSKQVKDLSTQKGKDTLKAQIKDKLNEITEDEVVEVCFTSFATQ